MPLKVLKSPNWIVRYSKRDFIKRHLIGMDKMDTICILNTSSRLAVKSSLMGVLCSDRADTMRSVFVDLAVLPPPFLIDIYDCYGRTLIKCQYSALCLASSLGNAISVSYISETIKNIARRGRRLRPALSWSIIITIINV